MQVAESLAGLATALTDYERETREVARNLEALVDDVASSLEPFLASEFPDADEGDVLSAIEGLATALGNARLDADRLAELSFDAMTIRGAILRSSGLRIRTDLLSEDAQGVFDALLIGSCNQIASIASRMERYTIAGLRRLLLDQKEVKSQLAAILGQLTEVSKAVGGHKGDLSSQYMRSLVRLFDRVHVYGIDVDAALTDYPLSTSFVMPVIEQRGEVSDDPYRALASLLGYEGKLGFDGKMWPEPPTKRLEDALTGQRFIAVVGRAGTGKTTLLQYIAVAIARQRLPDGLDYLESKTPFLLRLRTYRNQDLPAPSEFVRSVSRSLCDELPAGWATDLIESGRAVVMLDGLDEVPPERQDAVQSWMDDLFFRYGDSGSVFIVTGRPSAFDDFSIGDAFRTVRLAPMPPNAIRHFIRIWHRTVAGQIDDDAEARELERSGYILAEDVISHAAYRQLASVPLLCAALCALSRERESLPTARVSIYESLLGMLLARRELKKGNVQGVTIYPEVAVPLLRRLAEWMTLNGDTEVSFDDAAQTIARHLPYVKSIQASADDVMNFLLRRTEVVRQPAPGRVDFQHRTFQEFLTARALLDDRRIGQLLQHAEDSTWHETIVLAAAQAGSSDQATILTELLEKAETATSGRRALFGLLGSALEASVEVDPKLRSSIEGHAREFLPLRSSESVRDIVPLGAGAIPALIGSVGQSGGSPLPLVLRALIEIGGEAAIDALASLDVHEREAHLRELVHGWSYFIPERFAREVLVGPFAGKHRLRLEDVARVSFTQLCDDSLNFELHVRDAARDMGRLIDSGRVALVALNGCEAGISLDFLALLEGLQAVSIRGLRGATYSTGTAVLTRKVSVHSSSDRLDIGIITELFPNVQQLDIRCESRSEIVGLAKTRHLSKIEELAIASPKELDNLAPIIGVAATHLALSPIDGGIDLAPLAQMPHLESLCLSDVDGVLDVAALADCVSLRRLEIRGCSELRGLEEFADALSELSLLDCEAVEGLEVIAELATLELTIDEVPQSPDSHSLGLRPSEGEDLWRSF